MFERLKRRGTWSLAAGFGAIPIIDRLQPIEQLLADHGVLGAVVILLPTVCGVIVFAVEKRGDVNMDGRIDLQDAIDISQRISAEAQRLAEESSELPRGTTFTSEPIPKDTNRVEIDMHTASDDVTSPVDIPTVQDPVTVTYELTPQPAPPPEPAVPLIQKRPAAPLWVPDGEHWVTDRQTVRGAGFPNGNPTVGRPRRPHEHLYEAAVVHAAAGFTRQGFAGYEKWALEQRTRHSGYHIACALDLTMPKFLADAYTYCMYHGGPWNNLWGIVVVMDQNDWDDLHTDLQNQLAHQVCVALRYIRCTAIGVHPDNGRPVSDSNPLKATKHDLQLPQENSHVAHDWLWSDRDKNGKITPSDDWKSDPGEGLMNLVRSQLTAEALT